MTRALPTSRTSVDPVLLAAYNRGIDRARGAYDRAQAGREGYCIQCRRDKHRDGRVVCKTCRREMAAS